MSVRPWLQQWSLCVLRDSCLKHLPPSVQWGQQGGFALGYHWGAWLGVHVGIATNLPSSESPGRSSCELPQGNGRKDSSFQCSVAQDVVF